MNKRRKGYEGERIALQYYIQHGYQHVMSNFTVRGGEIDLIVEESDATVFIEVKVVDEIDDLFDYVTGAKLSHLRRTIGYYCMEYNTRPHIRIDVVFVKGEKIIEIYENIGS